ncbi:Site-2 protease family protein [Nitrospira tepida]|uniref:Site-2 protease family protein n=1 Tax=Nitrospira tepida TaxID=2973512 RepID=A0AA86N1R5_9BACT|nr:site-2 protease family protein [Nitrospira tepida]CAI4033059.1 Site-2 protease family protein [Nitrospira tepida]
MAALSQVLHKISYMGLPLLFAMVLHEFAHGWVANRLGDPTARLQGRLTLNPLAHIDPLGTVLVPLLCLLMPGGFFIGWAKPVPIDPRNLRHPRRDMAWVAAAGPAMNLVLAVLSAAAFSAFLRLDPTVGEFLSRPSSARRQDLAGMALLPLAVMSLYSVLINVLLMLFNLIPIPPLDGGRILTSLLPPRPALALAQLEPYGMILIFALVLLDPQIHVIGTVTGPLTDLTANTIVQQVQTLTRGVTP